MISSERMNVWNDWTNRRGSGGTGKVRITDEEGRLQLTKKQVNGMSLYEHGKDWKERREEEGKEAGGARGANVWTETRRDRGNAKNKGEDQCKQY